MFEIITGFDLDTLTPITRPMTDKEAADFAALVKATE